MPNSIASLLPDITIAASAIVGLLVLVNRYGEDQKSSSTARRLVALLIWLSLFLFVRGLAWVTDFYLFWSIQWFAAGMIPLFVLILTEGLLRQHAPKWAKLLATFGGIVLGVAAFWPGLTATAAFVYSMMGFQLALLIIVASLVLGRDRTSLSADENRAIFRISLSLIFVLPFLIADYHLDFMSAPVSPSGLAILMVCWLSLSLERARLNHGVFVGILALYIGLSVLAALILQASFGLSLTMAIQAGAVILALTLAAAILRDDMHMRAESIQNAVFSEMVSASNLGLDDYLSELARRGALKGALLLSSVELAPYDVQALVTHLAGKSGISVSDLPADRAEDDIVSSQLRTLFSAYAATNMFLVAEDPPMLALAHQPGFGAGTIDADLAAAFGLARLIAKREEKSVHRKRKSA